MNRSGAAAESGVDRLQGVCRKFIDALYQGGELGDRSNHTDLIQLLEVVLTPRGELRTSTHEQHRPTVPPAVGQAGQGVCMAGSAAHSRHAEPSREPAPGVCHIGGGLLVPHVHDSHTVIQAGIQKGIQTVSAEHKDLFDPDLFQGPHKPLSTVHFILL